MVALASVVAAQNSGTAAPGIIPTGYAAWWRADDLAISDAGSVSTWTDRSGNYTLTSTGTGTPTYRTDTANGHPVVEFDGVANRMTADTLAAAFNNTEYFHLFVVVNHLAPIGAQEWAVTFGSSTDYNETIGVGTTNDTVRLHNTWARNATAGLTQVFSKVPASVPGVVHLKRATTTITAQVGLEVPVTGAFTGEANYAVDRFTVGALGRPVYASNAHCQIAEIIAYPTALTTGQESQVVDYLRDRYGVGYVGVTSTSAVGATTVGAPADLAALADVATATGLREQDNIIHDPNDPNLGTYPEREWKHYYSVQKGAGVHHIYVVFSDDAGATWGEPTKCVMGDTDRISEDPSVVTLFATPGEAHRNGDGDLVLYCEDKTTTTTYAYTSEDGITWVSLGVAIDFGGDGEFDELLTGSPVPVFDGTNYIVGYEGIDENATESFGIASGTSPAVLTKSVNNPVWVGSTATSIIPDVMVKVGSRVALFAHSGIPGVDVWRGITTETNPLLWESGDITKDPAFDLFTVRNDLTVDFSDADLTTLISGNLADSSIVRLRLWGVAPWT